MHRYITIHLTKEDPKRHSMQEHHLLGDEKVWVRGRKLVDSVTDLVWCIENP